VLNKQLPAAKRGKTKTAKAKPPVAKLLAAEDGSHKVPAAKPIVRIGVLVHDVARMRKTIFDQAVRQMGITRAQWWALSNLSRNKSEGMNQSDLAKILDVGKPTIGGLIDRLVDNGMIERQSDGGDRRIRRIFITEKGYQLISHMSPVAARLNTVFLEGIDEKDVKIAEKVLEHLKENLRQLMGYQLPSLD
jgi:MarR family transcriptional regulator for hemolysin